MVRDTNFGLVSKILVAPLLLASCVSANSDYVKKDSPVSQRPVVSGLNNYSGKVVLGKDYVPGSIFSNGGRPVNTYDENIRGSLYLDGSSHAQIGGIKIGGALNAPVSNYEPRVLTAEEMEEQRRRAIILMLITQPVKNHCEPVPSNGAIIGGVTIDGVKVK
ncbi:MAG: hypothetical protein AABW73_01705 [Nanoarchaeota archaeon]